MAADLLKAVRQGPRSLDELREDLGWAKKTLRLWLNEMHDQGIVERAQGERKTGNRAGKLPFIYWLRREWGGQC